MDEETIALDRFGRRKHCFYCKWKLEHNDPNSRRYATRDHFIPKCDGGSNRSDNIVIACWQCNQEKDRRSAAEFMHYLTVVEGHRDMVSRRNRWRNYIRDHIIAALYPT